MKNSKIQNGRHFGRDKNVLKNWDGYSAEIPCGSNILLKSLYLAQFSRYKHFYPTALKGCRSIVFTHGVRMGGRASEGREKVCPGCISETVRCRKLIRGCRRATSWSDLYLTFDLAVVTLTHKILSGLYLGNREV